MFSFSSPDQPTFFEKSIEIKEKNFQIECLTKERHQETKHLIKMALLITIN